MLSSVVRAARASSARAAASPVSALGAIRGVSVLPNDADFNLVDRDALHPTDPLKRKPEIIKLPKAEQQQSTPQDGLA